MNTTNTHSVGPKSAIDSDEDAVVDCFLNGKPLDPVVAARIHERAQKIRERVFLKEGLVDIGVPAIREVRGELP